MKLFSKIFTVVFIAACLVAPFYAAMAEPYKEGEFRGLNDNLQGWNHPEIISGTSATVTLGTSSYYWIDLSSATSAATIYVVSKGDTPARATIQFKGNGQQIQLSPSGGTIFAGSSGTQVTTSDAATYDQQNTTTASQVFTLDVVTGGASGSSVYILTGVTVTQ